MSRIAKAPISVPSNVEVKVENGTIIAKGPKGELSFNLSPGIEVLNNDGSLQVQLTGDAGAASRHVRSMSGTTRAMVANLVSGVSEGFEKKLTIIGIGYRAQTQGKKLNLNLGFSHPVEYELPEGVSAETPTQTEIVLRGSDKQVIGQAAAEIRAFRPPEPYKGKGVRYSDEYVVRKQAKKK